MAELMCRGFKSVWPDFSESVGEDGNIPSNINDYCETLFKNKKCDNYNDKVNALSFWLFEQNLWDSSSSSINAKSNTDIVYYIVIWLIHMLRLKDGDQIDNVMKFYSKYINIGEDQINFTNDVRTYKSYMGLINSKLYSMNTDIKDISKFYDA
ncbi:Plasmodium variant antigen protein Cir/Yir/Bir, putative, partial [Plasmodium chabaudi adami]